MDASRSLWAEAGSGSRGSIQLLSLQFRTFSEIELMLRQSFGCSGGSAGKALHGLTDRRLEAACLLPKFAKWYRFPGRQSSSVFP